MLVLDPLQFKGMIANSVAKLTDSGEMLSNCAAKRRTLRLQVHGWCVFHAQEHCTFVNQHIIEAAERFQYFINVFVEKGGFQRLSKHSCSVIGM